MSGRSTSSTDHAGPTLLTHNRFKNIPEHLRDQVGIIFKLKKTKRLGLALETSDDCLSREPGASSSH